MVTKALAIDGSATSIVCAGYCMLAWDRTGRSAFLEFPKVFEGSYQVPLIHGTGLPKVPPTGVTRIEDFTTAKKATTPWQVESAISPVSYAYTQQNPRHNLYRIPLP